LEHPRLSSDRPLPALANNNESRLDAEQRVAEVDLDVAGPGGERNPPRLSVDKVNAKHQNMGRRDHHRQVTLDGVLPEGTKHGRLTGQHRLIGTEKV
jgi:hypothetical protein